ncbi:response regulator [Flaviramulus sp. BrNp1-15]|uniref:hybrid sensor histidine kinase/response regulator transcription factor n=1 Tax=Flaviramulus sp. BrNp1-15 TaxID=2916754 RepID=UPI001EE7D11A|nr:two-component regulator propeller domain-containing protein [Flaviramulus sp. BrNp1-15]ULC57938.1 response regulator [Flaviramulus sp. BrNp1-15]
MYYLKVVVIFLFLPVIALSQNNNKQTLQKQISFKSLTVEEGLSQNSVVSISQDSIGYLWFATQDGLNRYDGRNFKIYNKQFTDITRPTFSKLGKVYTDRIGQLWIVNISGELEKYIKEKDSFISVPRFKNVSDVYQDQNLNYYIGTYGHGLYKISKGDTIQVLNKEDRSKDIFNFYEDDNKVYVSASNSIIEITDNKEYSNKFINNSINYSFVTKTDKGLWFGTFGDGLYYFSKDNNKFEKFLGFNNNHLPDNLNIQSMLADTKNRLWIATYGQGVYLVDFSRKSISNFTAQKTNPFALHYNDILCLYQDFTGTIWLGSDGAGLSYYDENLAKFNVLTNAQTPINVNVDVVRSICTDNNNAIWLGTSGKGLTKYDRSTESFKTFTISNSKISSNRIMSLLFDDELLWIGLQGNGLNILDKSGSFISFNELSDYTIWKIFKDSNNRIWLATRDHGLIQFNKNKGIIKQVNNNIYPALTSNNIRTVEEGDTNSLWIGSEDKGLFKLDLKTDTVSEIKSVKDKIKSLFFDASNSILWIGTNGKGLKKFNTISNSIHTFSKDKGLPNNVVYSILPDDKNNLWLSSNRGITKFALTDSLQITNYNNYDGLQALEFNTGAYFKDKDGYLYFGGLEGLNWFKPSQLTQNPIAPKTVITALEVFAKPRELKANQLLKHNENTVTFTFAGLHFSLPERNNYQYQLVNHDENWIQSGNNNRAHYTNLEPNTYTFKVKSSNYDDVWSKDIASYSFTIKQPWYLTNLAKFIYALLFLLSILLIYKYLKWRWQMKMKLQMEHAETERLKKLDEFKTKLYTNISHEFRTPLTLISGPIERQLSKEQLSKQDKEELTLVQRNSKRLLNLVNQLLDLSKLESGSLKLSVSKDDLSVLLKQISSAFEYKTKEKNIQFEMVIPKMGLVYFDKDVIEKIITNLLSNAIKYAPENGFVKFNTTIKEGQLMINVINNGNTLSNYDMPKLFKRFYQTSKNSDGVGVGLALVKELTTLSHGNIVANTLNKDEIQFTVTLPVERSFFNPSEIVEEQPPLEDDNIKQNQTVSIDKDSSKEEKPVLLIVEDDLDVRQFVKSIFNSEFIIIEANNGERGIKKAITNIPDLIISDVMMPEKNGIELCNELKEDERTSHIPIILLTAKVGEENEIKGLTIGADAYITKPFSSSKLKIRVQKLIELRRQLQKRYSQELKVDAKDLSTSSVDQQFFKRIQKVLDDQLINPEFNSKTFVITMQMSRMQLHRKLKALTGLTTSEFIRSQRLKLALGYLKESDLTVSEVAYQVGFNTPSYFIKCFKEAYNCTPNEYISK